MVVVPPPLFLLIPPFFHRASTSGEEIRILAWVGFLLLFVGIFFSLAGMILTVIAEVHQVGRVIKYQKHL